MTVAELIEELKKFPSHHPVILETDEPDYESGGSCEIWSYVVGLDARSNVGDLGPVVLIQGGDPA